MSDTKQTAILIFREDGVSYPQLPPDVRTQTIQKLVTWVAELKRRGIYAGVEGLDRAGKTVRRKGAGLVVDGPFAEGREAVLGFVMVRVADLDEACAIAGESPHAEVGGATEVRLVSAFPKP